MDYEYAALFVRVVETGSFTAAARALALPKSSVSRAVTKLERELGVRLLQRTTRALALTDAGRRFFDRVRGAVQGLDEAEAAAREEGSEPRGVVRMTAPSDAHAFGLGEALAAFRHKYPRVELELTSTSRLVDLVAEGFDLAVRAGVLRDSSLVARKIGSSDMMLFASPAYLDQRSRPQALADLATHDFVLYGKHVGRRTLRLQGPSGEAAFEAHARATADDLVLLATLAVGGAGIALLPTSLAGPFVDRGQLELVLHDHRLTGGGVFIVLPSSAYVPARVAVLRDFLVDELGKRMAGMEKRCTEARKREAR